MGKEIKISLGRLPGEDNLGRVWVIVEKGTDVLRQELSLRDSEKIDEFLWKCRNQTAKNVETLLLCLVPENFSDPRVAENLSAVAVQK